MSGRGPFIMRKCALCHGIESGTPEQKFPSGPALHPIAGLRICDIHAQKITEIAADAGIHWAPVTKESPCPA